MTDTTPEPLRQLARQSANSGLQIPPPAFIEMEGTIERIDQDQGVLVASFPVLQRFQNPMGYMQGGMIAAAIDNAIGPLSFLMAPISVTKRLEIDYLKGISPDIARITVRAQISERSGKRITFSAEVHGDDGRLLARALAHHVIVAADA